MIPTTWCERIRRLRVRWRRWRLFRAYCTVVKRRTGCVSLVPYIGALERMEDDGLLEVEDGEVTWYWPENSA